MSKARLALFLFLGQTAERAVLKQPETAAQDSLPISKTMDLALSLPQEVKDASSAAAVYKYLYVFENFLRELIQETLSEDSKENWWELKIPKHIKDEVSSSKTTEETKAWMALGARQEIALTTYPQLIAIIEHRWKEDFEDIIRDKSLLQEAKHITHMRNAICHMTSIPEEEIERIKQVLRDWFRIVTP